MASGSAAWAAEEFGGADLGDSRRVSRLLGMGSDFAEEAWITVRSDVTAPDTHHTVTKKSYAIQVHALPPVEESPTPAGEKPLEWLLLTNRPAAP